MPDYGVESSGRFAPAIGMPGINLGDPTWTIGIHDRPFLKAHKQLPRRRDQSLPSVDLRSHYKKTQVQLPNRHRHNPPNLLSTTPPDPPETAFFKPLSSPVPVRDPSEHSRDDLSNAETAILRSRVATPTYQNSPPTPDITPPRARNLLRPHPLLANVPSISSRTESFKTAKEELSSDEEIDAESPSQRPSRQRWLQSSHAARLEDWGVQPNLPTQTHESQSTPTKVIKRKPLPKEAFSTFDGSWKETGETKVNDWATSVDPASSTDSTIDNTQNGDSIHSVISHPSPLPTPPRSAETEQKAKTPEPPLQRGKSLRDRLKETRMVRASDSTEDFARDIGWSHVYKSPELQSRINSWRLSGISTTSTVEAIVVDAETTPQRQRRLRHSRKNPSLRSTSSPFPASNRSSLFSNPESPHRLIHKKGKITNQIRWSIGSEASKMMRGSPAMTDAIKPEIIPVAVIPERMSSLQSSEDGSRRHSASLSANAVVHHPSTAPDHTNAEPHVPLRKKRPMSASLPVGGSFGSRGRQQDFAAAALPLRGTSLSVPTSRSHSRANSPTSEHFRLRRLAAEEDLHRTLERMESERSVPRYSAFHSGKGPSNKAGEPDKEQWDDLRSPSLYTAFSPPSMESASPGPVEMGEARAVNLFAHNNHSLQIVDQYPQPESRTFLFLQKASEDRKLPTEEPSTPTQAPLPQLLVDSPLRNPRDPPQPPALKVIPPTPLDLTPVEYDDRQLGVPSSRAHKRAGSLSRRFGSLTRPTLGTRRHSESFVKSLSRTLSLKGARNMKADQPMDASLHPFWRPRGFWDDVTDSNSDDDDYERDVIVSNSLGVPQQRTIIDGPVSLVRHLSDRSRRRRQTGAVTRRSSHGSLARTRIGRRGYKIPGLGRYFPLRTLGDMHGRLQLSKRQKENEKRERTRQALREKIGPQIVSTGDSRYPAYMPPVNDTIK